MSDNKDIIELTDTNKVVDQETAKTAIEESDNKEEYTVERYRWLILLIYSINAMWNQVAQIGLQPVIPQIVEYYGQSITTANILSLAYQGVYIFFTFPSNYLIDTKGCRSSVLTGITLTALGMVIKTGINSGFWICIIGQLICGIGQPFLSNSPAKVAAVWFPPNERIIAMTACTITQAVGTGVGFLMPTIWITLDDTKEEFQANIVKVLWTQAAFGIFLFLSTLFLFKNQPSKPPSLNAFAISEDSSVQALCKSTKDLLQFPNFNLLIIVFGQILGSFNTLGTILGIVTQQYGFSIKEGSSFGAMFVAGGIIGSIVMGIWVEKTKAYKLVVSVICTGACLFCLFDYFLFRIQNGGLTKVLAFFQGAISLPILSIALDFGVELTYPIGESFSTGILMCSGQLFGIIYTVIASNMLSNMTTDTEPYGADASLILLTVVCSIGAVCSYFIKNDIRRVHAEREHEKNKDKAVIDDK